MDWDHLRFFLAVARTGTLVGAGRELGVEHTTVSRRLAALEAALGARLFTRGPEGLSLTAPGLEILSSVEAMQAHAQTIQRRVRGDDSKAEGLVRLTIPENVNAYMLQELAALRAEHPGLVVELLVDNRMLDLRRGEADLALRFGEVTDPELVVRKVGACGWSLYAAPSYIARKGGDISPHDVAGHDVIGFDTSLIRTCGATWLQRCGKGANVVLRGNSLAAVQSAACCGFGIVALPCICADADSSLKRLTPELIGASDILLVVHPDLTRVGRVRVTIDFLVCLMERDAARWLGR